MSSNKNNNRYFKLSEELLKEALRLSEIGSQVFLLGQGISNFSKDEQIKLISVLISFTGGTILTVSTVLQFIQNYFSDRPIPKELNYNKLLGSILGLMGAIVSTKTIFDIYDLNLPKEDVEDTTIN